MKVWINQQAHELPEAATVRQALAAIAARPPFAVAVNLQFVPQADYDRRTLQPEDRIEVIAPVTGG